MMILWLVVAVAMVAAALIVVPRKKDIPVSQEEIQQEKQIRHELFLKEEKDTRRFYEDIRRLYPV
jgi:transcription initiation factor TFIIIB Brf1 subunit/transcription initiation factor TFIIB